MSADNGFFSNGVQLILSILVTILSAAIIAAVTYIFRLNSRLCDLENKVSGLQRWLNRMQELSDVRIPQFERLITKVELIKQDIERMRYARGYPGKKRSEGEN